MKICLFLSRWSELQRGIFDQIPGIYSSRIKMAGSTFKARRAGR
jgi:hypothetical protein